jgi:hypothetical protein
MLDLPDPFRPVIELKLSSHPEMTVRTAYDLKPWQLLAAVARGFRLRSHQ